MWSRPTVPWKGKRAIRSENREPLHFNQKEQGNTDENFSTFVNAINGLMDPHTDYFPIDLRSSMSR